MGRPRKNPEEEFDLAVLSTRVLGELQRRFGEPEQAKEIPGTGLIQLAKELIKLGEREKPEEDEENQTSILELLDTPGLPDNQKLTLAKHEIQRIESDLSALYDKVRELENDAAQVS